MTAVCSWQTQARAELDNRRLFTKCYSQLTGEPIQRSDPRLHEVEQGRNPVDACMDVFDTALLSTQGLLQSSDPIGIRVLNHMNEVHRSWLPMTPAKIGLPDATADVYDMGSAAYYFTQALFQESVPFEVLLNGNQSLEGVRDGGRSANGVWTGAPISRIHQECTHFANNNEVNAPFYATYCANVGDTGGSNGRPPGNGCPQGCECAFGTPGCSAPASCPAACGTFSPPLSFEPPMQGALTGIQPLPPSRLNTVAKSPSDTGAAMFVQLFRHRGSPQNYITGQYVNPNLLPATHTWATGGGLLGDPVFIMRYLGILDRWANGGSLTARRYAEAAIETALCRKQPTMRYDDATPFVKPSSPLSFQKAATCMRCHATIDEVDGDATSSGAGIGGVARNFTIRQSLAGSLPTEPIIYHLTETPVTLPPRTSMPANATDPVDYKRPADFKWVFRTHSGEAKVIQGRGISALGEAMAGLEEFPICMAKRYFQHFTNINVNVDDIGNLVLSPEEQAYREAVVEMGRALQNHHSLRLLIRRIFEHPTYREAAE